MQSGQHFQKGVGWSEIEKHVEVNNSDDMLGGLEDRRPATARSKGKLPRLLCCRARGVDQPGARGGARRYRRRRSPTHSLEVNALQSCGLLI